MDKLNQVKVIAVSCLLSLCTSCATVSPKTCNTSMTDNDITTNVQTRIAGEKGLGDNNVQVSTYERVVTLTGSVQNPTQADVAYVLAKSVPDVKYVISKITLRDHNFIEAQGQLYD